MSLLAHFFDSILNLFIDIYFLVVLCSLTCKLRSISLVMVNILKFLFYFGGFVHGRSWLSLSSPTYL